MASGGAHVVFLPFVQQGHINPLLQVARTLASRGVQATFLLPDEAAAKSRGLPPSAPHLKFLILPTSAAPQPSSGDPFRDDVQAMRDLESPLSTLLHGLQPPASALVYDSFVTWAPRLACALSIPSLCFITVNATAAALLYHLPSLVSRRVLPFRPDGDKHSALPQEKIKGLEGLPELLPEDFPIDFTLGPANFSCNFLVNVAEKVRDASAIIINSIEDLEPDAIAVWKSRKPVFTIGPLLLLSGRCLRLDFNFWPEDDHCLTWLDSQAPSSVIYISFGSVVGLSLPQFQELAWGLDASRQPFLWVVRADSINTPLERALPVGFRERTKDRGMIVTWGPQLLILSHPAIGGFLTHGGWNSIIENISLGSVPMVVWPHIAEQHFNRCLVVEHWKIAIRLQDNADGSVSQGEIVQAVHGLFHGEQAAALKNASKKVGDMAKAAFAEGGSSQKSCEALCTFLFNSNAV